MHKPLKYSFKKSERLCSKKLIETLFQSGSSIMAFPIRVQYLLIDSDDTDVIKVLLSVPKKRFKRAVKRNLIRRRMKEAFRLNKHLLYANVPEGKQLIWAFIYIDSTIQPYDVILKGILKTFERYCFKHGKTNIRI